MLVQRGKVISISAKKLALALSLAALSLSFALGWAIIVFILALRWQRRSSTAAAAVRNTRTTQTTGSKWSTFDAGSSLCYCQFTLLLPKHPRKATKSTIQPSWVKTLKPGITQPWLLKNLLESFSYKNQNTRLRVMLPNYSFWQMKNKSGISTT